jgi:hypothetical protein
LPSRRVIDLTPSVRLLYDAVSRIAFRCFVFSSLFNLQGTRSNCESLHRLPQQNGLVKRNFT